MNRYLPVIAVTAIVTALVVLSVDHGMGHRTAQLTGARGAGACMQMSEAADRMKCLQNKLELCKRFQNTNDSGTVRTRDGVIGTDPLRTYEGCMADVQQYLDQMRRTKVEDGTRPEKPARDTVRPTKPSAPSRPRGAPQRTAR